MPKTIEEITSKINEKLTSELKRDDAEELLKDIRADISSLKESAQEKYKEIVDKKVDELRKIIKENLFAEEEPNWRKTQDDLSKIKKGLEDLKDEIMNKLKESMNASTVQKLSTVDVSGDVKKMTTTYVEAGVKATDIPILKEIGGLLGLATAAYHGTIETGAFFAEKAMEDTKELVQDAGSGAFKLTEKFTDVGAKTYEDTRKGLENVTIGAMTNATDVTKSFFDIFKSNEPLEVKIEMLKKQAEETVKAKDSIITLLKQQIEGQKKELDQRQEQINSLIQQQSQSSLGVMQIAQTLATSRPSSPSGK